MISSAAALEESAQSLLDDAIADADAEGLSGPIESRLVLGTPGHAVLGAAEDADLIVVGSRQHSAAGCLFLGSVSLQITHHAACPVIVVPSVG